MIALLAEPLLLFILFGFYVALNIMDGISTWFVLKPDRFDREVNPLARWCFIKLGIPRGIIIVEAGVLAVLCPLILWLAGRYLIAINLALIVVVSFFIWLVGDNIRLMLILQRRARNSQKSGKENS